MSDYFSILDKYPCGVIASVDNGRPRTRVFQYLWRDGCNIYFCTGAGKEVYRQLQANPYASFCTWNPETFETVSLNGKVVFDDDFALKEKALTENPSIKEIYGGPENPDFKIFYVDTESVDSFSFASGTKRHKIK